MRTKAQRRWIRKGHTHEMIPPRPLPYMNGKRYSYLLGAHESWRQQRSVGLMLDMPVRPICKQMIHNGGKP